MNKKWTCRDIAQCVYNIIDSYRDVHDEPSQPSWHELPEEERTSLTIIVENTIDAGLKYDPALAHGEWVKAKFDLGWKHGSELNVPEKLHPCMPEHLESVDELTIVESCDSWYDDLSREQQMKDTIFFCVVKGLSPFLETEE